MDCFINSGIYLRANGSVRCGCDAGTHINLQPFDSRINYATDVFMGLRYQDIRNNLKENRVPFPNNCPHCQLLQMDRPFNPAPEKEKTIELFQIEPSFACTLECEGCWKIKDRKGGLPKTDVGHLYLSPEVFEKIISDLAGAGIRINSVSIEGHGEPLLNKHVWKMIQRIKTLFPKAFISLNTNANAVFAPEMLDTGIDELVCSIDGIDQDTYVQYRAGGDFNKAFSFMKNFATEARNRKRPVRTVWKYIIFKHNDRPEQLLKAQELALQAGVTRLVFVITHYGPASHSIFNAEQIPRLGNGVLTQVISLIMPLEETQKRLMTLFDEIKTSKKDGGYELPFHALFKRLFSMTGMNDSEGLYGLLRSMATSQEVSMKLRGEIVIAHDRLIQDGIIKLPGKVAPPKRLFDEAYYLRHNTDVSERVKTGRISGFDHFRLWGRMEGRRPHA